ncbi:hypothetical protein RirG_045670 [Rhizophagus irregularis DAOM 197198w]|uniref:Uncharacterized protein n=1 Tax=Rhizophagus irregularis (strain DAOM 197198w) TaxID=1432141 RepID=A0A015JZP9_RHIIW|nr:hypothetical protein RirG_045670 [Rhizophagus irregularis DAOM 197198w]
MLSALPRYTSQAVALRMQPAVQHRGQRHGSAEVRPDQTSRQCYTHSNKQVTKLTANTATLQKLQPRHTTHFSTYNTLFHVQARIPPGLAWPGRLDHPEPRYTMLPVPAVDCLLTRPAPIGESL